MTHEEILKEVRDARSSATRAMSAYVQHDYALVGLALRTTMLELNLLVNKLKAQQERSKNENQTA